MKKLVFSIVCMAWATAALAQGNLGKGGKQLNAGVGFSSFGVPVYVGADFGVHESISIGPRISYRNYSNRAGGFRYSQSLTVLSFNGNYHFNTLFNLPPEWNLYAGLTLGYYFWSDVKWNDSRFDGFGGEGSGVGLDLQVGGRYFFDEKWGVNLEFGGGTISGGSFGITYKL